MVSKSLLVVQKSAFVSFWFLAVLGSSWQFLAFSQNLDFEQQSTLKVLLEGCT